MPADVDVVVEEEVRINLLPLQTLFYRGNLFSSHSQMIDGLRLAQGGLYIVCVLLVGLKQYMRLMMMTFILINL